MWEWASKKPQRCLKLGTDAAAWAETERNWRGRERYRCVASPLPDGLVKPSPADLNVSDVSALQGRLRALAGVGSDAHAEKTSLVTDLPRRITLLLPDAAVRAVVLHLDQLPANQDERDALIRWRLGQEQLFSLVGAKVVSQVFHAASGQKSRVHTVLTVAIQESVLQQYESLCESIGLIPHDVGITSLRLFDLWQRVSGGPRRQKTDFLWANVGDGALTTMVFQQGRLLFYRCKLLRGEAMESGAKADLLDKIVEECGASLDVCQQRHPTAVIKHAVLCVDRDLASLKSRLEAGLEVSVEQLEWGSLETLGLVTKGGQRGMASLAAMAGVS